MRSAPASDRTMFYWLALVLREERQGSGLSATRLAADLGVSESTVTRFEKAHTWPQRVDDYVAVYAAYLSESQDARDYWGMAIDRWRQEGQPPLIRSPGGVLLQAPPGELGRIVAGDEPTSSDRRQSGSHQDRGARRDSGGG